MKMIYIAALAVMVLALAASIASADMPAYNYNYGTNISPPQYCPSCAPAPACTTCAPSVPACVGCGPVVTGYPASDCCNVAPMGTCGSFCAAGQASPGWPYNWCSEYWLRPNSNF